MHLFCRLCHPWNRPLLYLRCWYVLLSTQKDKLRHSYIEQLIHFFNLGYYGYPNCKEKPEETEEDASCKAQLLPHTLDTIPYLGYDNEVRLQGYYYIDVAHRYHEIEFRLEQDSLFRMYLQPHWVDVDIWLYLITGSKTVTVATGTHPQLI